MSDVPAEILREILSRLPVAPLLRFRCVSKQWKCLIDSNDFLKDHLHHSRKSNSHLSIIMRNFSYLHSIDFDLLNQTNRAPFQQLSHPLKTPSWGTDIMGSCDGLLALSNVEELENGNILWNPSARRFHKLPFSGIEFPVSQFLACIQYVVFGFGYDFVNDDYKLLRIAQFYGDNIDYFQSEVKIYNLKSDSWRRIPDFPYYLLYRRHGVLVNGALHWIVTRKVKSDTDRLLAAFDLGTEECRLVPLPVYAGDNVHVNVEVFGGCLSITCNYSMNHVDLWVMKEYGVKESWSLLFTLSHSEISFLEFNCLIPIEYSKCGRKVLIALDWRMLIWYDLDKKSVDLLEVQFPSEKCYGYYPCLQSLVLLKSGTRDFNIGAKKNQKTKSKKKGSGKRDGFLSKGFKLVL